MARIYDKYPALKGKDPDVRARRYVTPNRVVWTSKGEGAEITGEESLLLPRAEQISFGEKERSLKSGNVNNENLLTESFVKSVRGFSSSHVKNGTRVI